MLARTARASSVRFRATSQRGLEGVRKRSRKKAAAGSASTPNIHRHSAAPRPSWTTTIVREVGEQDPQNDVELGDRHQPAPERGGGDLRDVHRRDDRGPADAQAAEEAEDEKRGPAPGQSAPDRRDEVEESDGEQDASTAKGVRGASDRDRADDRPDEGTRHGEAEPEAAQPIHPLKGLGRSRDDRGVEAEEQTTQRGDDGASGEGAGQPRGGGGLGDGGQGARIVVQEEHGRPTGALRG